MYDFEISKDVQLLNISRSTTIKYLKKYNF